MVRLGQILMFSGDFRIVNASIKNVDAFTAVSASLRSGATDVTGLYIDTSPSFTGNTLISDKIGGKAEIPPGNYRYFISGTYDSKVRTWFWDVVVLAKDLSRVSGIDISNDDYDPFAEEVSIFEGDRFGKELIVPGLEFTAAEGEFRLLSQDMTSTYCSGSASASGDRLTTHNIGGAGSIPPGDYGYFISGTYDNGDAKATWCFPVKVVPKQGVL